jgi:hypothetical protein
MGVVGLTVEPWPEDPWADRRQVMLETEFDAVDYFVHEPDRAPPPPPKLGVYLASALSQPAMAERLPGIVADMQAVLDETVAAPMRPAEIGHALAGRPTGGRAWRGDATMRWLTDALRGGEVEGIDIAFHSPDDPEDRFWHLEIQALPGDTDASIMMSLVPSDNLWPAGATDALAERLLRVVESWTEPLDLRTSAVTHDRVQAGASPWEQWYAVNIVDLAQHADTYLRGYFWANLLTAGHLDRLGGLDELRRRADGAGCAVTVLPARPSAAPAVLVRSPDPVTAFDDTRLATMKDLLTPALYPQPYTLYEGYPLRIIRDPGTAFRRVPATEPRPMLRAADET